MLNHRLLPLFLLLTVAVNCDEYDCPPEGSVYAACSATIAYLIDDSIDLSDSQIQATFNFTRYQILPGTDWNRGVYTVFFTYGAAYGVDCEPSNLLIDACTELGNLQSLYETASRKSGSLYQALEWLDSHYPQLLNEVVIFSGDKDSMDVMNAGNYAQYFMPQVRFTVIGINGAVFDRKNFNATIYHVNDMTNPPERLYWCVINSACGIDPGCDIDERPHPTTRTTTTTRSTPTTTTTMRSTTSNPDNTPPNLQCQCDTMSAWLDIIFVIDASASTGEMGLDEMWGMAGTMLELFNVQMTGYSASNYTSRVGIITYGNTANVLYPHGSLDNTLINNLLNLPFNDDQMTNLEAGLQAAVDQFNGPNHRSNAREIIVVMAAAFDPIGTNAPNKTAATFKEDGGILMVFNYVPQNGIESPMLASIASPGYFFSTTLNSHYTDLALGLCDANCFCRDNLHAYGLTNQRQYPTKGCYIGITAENNYARAVNSCKSQYYGGTVATDKDSMKTTFLKTLFPSNNAFYIGLTYDNLDRRWEWPDGTSPGAYQPWAGNKAPDGSSQQCVYLNPNSQWQATDCRNGFHYVCEIAPCDSVHYCG